MPNYVYSCEILPEAITYKIDEKHINLHSVLNNFSFKIIFQK